MLTLDYKHSFQGKVKYATYDNEDWISEKYQCSPSILYLLILASIIQVSVESFKLSSLFEFVNNLKRKLSCVITLMVIKNLIFSEVECTFLGSVRTISQLILQQAFLIEKLFKQQVSFSLSLYSRTIGKHGTMKKRLSFILIFLHTMSFLVLYIVISNQKLLWKLVDYYLRNLIDPFDLSESYLTVKEDSQHFYFMLRYQPIHKSIWRSCNWPRSGHRYNSVKEVAEWQAWLGGDNRVYGSVKETSDQSTLRELTEVKQRKCKEHHSSFPFLIEELGCLFYYTILTYN